jgi:hypothetical protein
MLESASVIRLTTLWGAGAEVPHNLCDHARPIYMDQN